MSINEFLNSILKKIIFLLYEISAVDDVIKYIGFAFLNQNIFRRKCEIGLEFK